MRLPIFVLLAFFAAALAQPAQAEDDKKFTLKHDGETREYFVHAPVRAQAGGALPVVLFFHGGGGTAEGAATMSGMNTVADANGFLVAYPQGISKTWNAGHCCGSAMKKNVDDVGFVADMIDDLAAHYPIDKKRIYATGLSNGSQFSYRLSCDLSTRIAAVAPVSGQSVLDSCHPVRAVAVLHIHGTADQCAKYSGGEKCGNCFSDFFRSFGIPFPQQNWQCEAVEQQIVETAQRNGCGTTAQVFLRKGAVTCSRFEGCPAGADVNFCKIEGGGHSWPDGVAPSFCKRPDGMMCREWKKQVGETNHDINASQMIWQFFTVHKLNN